MRSTFNILYYIDRRRVKADGTTAVLCRISIDAKNAVVNTGICCIPETYIGTNIHYIVVQIYVVEELLKIRVIQLLLMMISEFI